MRRLLQLPRENWQRLSTAYLRTDKTRTLMRGSVSVLLLRYCAHGLRLLLGVLLAQALGASGYGVYAYCLTWLALLQIIALLGLDQILIRYVATYKETKAWSSLMGLLRFASSIGFASSIIVGLSCMAIVKLFQLGDADARLTMMITIGLLPIVTSALLRQAVLRGLDHSVLAQLPENILYPGAFIIMMLVIRFAGWGPSKVGPEMAALLNAASWVFSFGLGSIIVLRKLPEPARRAKPAYDRETWFLMVPGLFVSAGAYYLFSRADVLILGGFANSRELGLYIIAGRGAELMTFVYEALTLAGTSLFAGIYASGDRVELQRFANLVTKSIFWFSLPAYPLMMLLTPLFLRLFGSEFAEGIVVMRLLLTTYFISTLGGFVVQMLYVTGNEKPAATVMLGAAGLNIALSFLFIPRFGMVGAALASGLSLIAMKGALVYVLYKRVGVLSLPFKFRRSPA